MIDPLYVPNTVLNRNISLDEINFVINHIKNNKAPGIDKIPNEVLRTECVKKCLLGFFKYHFDTSLLPQCWGQAIIKPIPKIKANDPWVPLNYRGINSLSCINKAYSTIIKKTFIDILRK